jgi:acyl-CoA thioester hydrolase
MSHAEKVYRSTFPVRYHETDQMGVVHHGVYVTYFEVGRTEMMKAHGLDYAEMERQGILLTVTEVGLRYLAPARFGDLIEVHTWLKKVERVRVHFSYEIRRSAEELVLCQGHTVLACVNPKLVPTRLPTEIRTGMLELCV